MLTQSSRTNAYAPRLQCIPHNDCAKTSLLILLLIRLVLAGFSPRVLGSVNLVILVRHSVESLLDVAVKILCEIFVADL